MAEEEIDWEQRERELLAATRRRQMPNDAKLIEHHRKMQEQTLRDLHRRWLADGNTLHVWAAIRACHPVAYPPRRLPDWVVAYLASLAVDIGVLARLRDPLAYPVRQPGETLAAHTARHDAWANATPLTGTTAARLLPRVMGFVRKGWNAFTRADAVESDKSLAFAARFSGMQEAALIEQEQRRRNLAEPRSVKRRLTRGRKLLGAP